MYEHELCTSPQPSFLLLRATVMSIAPCRCSRGENWLGNLPFGCTSEIVSHNGSRSKAQQYMFYLTHQYSICFFSA
ncbi:uncharacterized protein TEOVI_000378000 [Trypanosoma equiperdum]|uniref:Uncharacterized protein n=1 Tax=Trypanosoma equiperdum TaxID=5694 RepID=A0A1G4IIQ3_TRYEQ|nr:hypothetical protein, conserved [Trypanosoma equiperdum]